MDTPVSMVGVVSYGAGTAAFVALALFLAAGWRDRSSSWLLLAAILATAAWCAVNTLHYWSGVSLYALTSLLEDVRTIAWLVFLWRLLTQATDKPFAGLLRTVGQVAAVTLLVIVIFDIVYPLSPVAMRPIQTIMRLVLAVSGLALVENLIRNGSMEQRWSFKFLCIGLGGIFIYEMLFYADTLLFGEPNPSLAMARGAIQALVMPLLLLAARRSDLWESRIAISQRTAVYTTALIASGLYLVFMALAAFYIRIAGGSWGLVVQAIFMFGGFVVLAIVLASGAARAHLKVFVSKHFFRYKFDYREEWMRFMEMVSDRQEGAPLELRVVEAIARPVDSPGGALWLRRSGSYALAATLNMTATSLADDDVAPLAAFFAEREWIVDIMDVAESGADEADIALPEGITRIESAWILTPLLHASQLIGFVVLARPRAARDMTWEDYDLLRLLGRQSASYLAEQMAAQQLAEARQFERFNRRATFVMHDLKNLVSQLSLVSTNVEKHGDKPEFRKDMTMVMTDAVARMNRLMERLHAEQEARGPAEMVAVKPLLDQLATANGNGAIDVRCDARRDEIAVRANRDRLGAMLSHLIRNAVEAAGEDGRVRIALSGQTGSAVVEISDNGPGMDRAFIEQELFKPFSSTKKGGFGIGAYQCRQYARELGGEVEVISSPGAGTTMRVVLPVARAEAAE